MPDPLDQPPHAVARDEPQSQRMAKPRATSLAESPERMMHPLPNRLHRGPAITKLARLPVHYSVLRCTLRPSGRSSAAVPAVASCRVYLSSRALVSTLTSLVDVHPLSQ